MADDDIYRKQTFGQKTGFGKKPVLLVVDFVNGFTDPEVFGGGNIADAVTATVPLLDFFRARKLPVAFTRIVYADDGSDCGIWCEKVPRPPRTHRSLPCEPGRGRARAAAGRNGDPENPGLGLLRHPPCRRAARQGRRHHRPGRLHHERLRAGDRDRRDELQLPPVVASDCVGDRALGPHEANLFDLGQKYADLITAREIMDTLAARTSA